MATTDVVLLNLTSDYRMPMYYITDNAKIQVMEKWKHVTFLALSSSFLSWSRIHSRSSLLCLPSSLAAALWLSTSYKICSQQYNSDFCIWKDQFLANTVHGGGASLLMCLRQLVPQGLVPQGQQTWYPRIPGPCWHSYVVAQTD